MSRDLIATIGETVTETVSYRYVLTAETKEHLSPRPRLRRIRHNKPRSLLLRLMHPSSLPPSLHPIKHHKILQPYLLSTKNFTYMTSGAFLSLTLLTGSVSFRINAPHQLQRHVGNWLRKYSTFQKFFCGFQVNHLASTPTVTQIILYCDEQFLPK